MRLNLGSVLKHSWSPFRNREPTKVIMQVGPGYSNRPDRPRFTRGNERSIVTSVYNRIAIDTAMLDVRECILDADDRFTEVAKTKLNDCFTVEANIDQTGRAFLQDAVMSMLDEGCVALVPIDVSQDPDITQAYDINAIRTGQIVEWYSKDVRIRMYGEDTGVRRETVLPKKFVSIIENPLYSIMNEPNSTLQRLIHKLNLLDAIDEQSSSGKLDLIIQLPYVVKTERKREQAEERRKQIEEQLYNSQYGIAYTDASEHITQLNRPVENNLMKQIEYLTSMLYSQLGITQSILDGTADETTMLNYHNRTIGPIITAIVEEMRRKFLTKTARTQGHTIMFFRDPFKLVPVSQMADIVDKYTRNEVATSNEFRAIMGWKPSKDPRADELRNKNIAAPADQTGFHVPRPTQDTTILYIHYLYGTITLFGPTFQ